MNIIYMGQNVYGVKAAALAYFDKDVSDLSLAECAFLAGITNNPAKKNMVVQSTIAKIRSIL